MLEHIVDGRTDLVFDYLAAGHSAQAMDPRGVSLMQWCAYYGDVSAMRYLIMQGAKLSALGENLDLNAAAFHGHWRLCQFLIEQGADVNHTQPDTGETPLHAATSKGGPAKYDLVIKVLLAAGAAPNCPTRAGVETGCFMRDCRTKGETPLHRAAAFGSQATIERLLDAGADIGAKDANGDTPLSWASWYARPNDILRKLCYGDFAVNPQRQTMEDYLLGRPHE